MDEEKSSSSTLQKRRSVILFRIFPDTMRTFAKDTTLSEQAGARHGMCELTHGMAGEGHGHGMLCVNPP